MANRSHLNLKAIRFNDELLQNWAQLLDLASRLCPVSDEARRWFSTLTNSNGVDDARTILAHCELLRSGLQSHREEVLAALRRDQPDGQETQVYGAWLYSLDTIIQQASCNSTCSWEVEGLPGDDEGDPGDDGEIGLRRV